MRRRVACTDGRRSRVSQARGSRVPGAEGVSAGAGAGEGEGQVGEDALDERCNEV